MRHQLPRIALVTGASRGVGAEVAQQLAGAGTHVIVNDPEDTSGADVLVAAIRYAGGQASAMSADITDEDATTAMIGTIERRFGRLDALILDASGGLEFGADPGYAMRLNRDAQRRLALLALPLMTAGGRIVFVTSHQAHFFPDKAVPKGYAGIAASMRAGETALYARRAEFARAGIQFTVVSGNTSDEYEFAAAVVNSATTPSPSGVVYVGGATYQMTA